MRIDRLISIIMLLMQRRKVDAKELAAILEVTTRTIYRDVEAINQAGIPIITYPGRQGGIGILEEYKVDKKLFTNKDIRTMLIGLSGVQSVLKDEQSKNAIIKVKGMVPSNQLSLVERQTEQIVIDLTPWYADARLEQFLECVHKALDQQKIVHFEYCNAKGRTSNREVEPYRLVHKGNHWYLQGFCRTKQVFRTFRVYRISNISLSETTFVPSNFEIAEMDASFSKEASWINVQIRFNENIKKTMIDYYGEDCIVSYTDGWYTATILLEDNEQGYDSLLRFTNHCECLSPSHIREHLIEKAAGILSLYGR
ncbi:helix-turn-helix transcriptional regulator [Paenibacillus humicus]|uniref:helix-turn-helix transcriptional regulator n=1 Tax=Paenibacillus humicus TaxID=412861 RepID=UPI0013E3816A|nr:YafY family protein [Paenibacillus humicus]